MMSDLLDVVKQKLKIDEAEDELVSFYIESAKESLKQSGVEEQDSALYQNAVMIQVLLDYENQDKDLNVGALKNALHSIVLKLKTYKGESE